MTETVHLVDASPYIFRGFFALPSSLTDPQGRSINAVHGFAGFLLRLLAEERPSHLGVVFDGSLTTSFRNEIYPEYKAHREPPPQELLAQLEDCRAMAEALGAESFVDRRFEADDLIGTLAVQLAARGRNSVVVSSDKDLAQLVGERCELFDFARDTRFGVAEVREKFGVAPEQLVDYLALAGDPVDNIPGVKGVGAKSAVALLGLFGSLEGLYERLDEVPSAPLRGARSLASKLREARKMALVSQTLARIVTDAPIRADLDALAYRGAIPELVDPLFERLGSERLRDRIQVWS